MTEFVHLRASDTQAWQEITEAATDILRDMAIESGDTNMLAGLETGEITTMPKCVEASDAVTRAAHNLGIFASRETNGRHWITTFSNAGDLPSDDDLVGCLTYGQFDRMRNPETAPTVVPPFFGVRQDIKPLLPRPESYGMFVPFRVRERQIVHAQSFSASSLHHWLATKPADVASGSYSAGVVAYDAYPRNRWSIY